MARTKYASTTFWIDALCIDQENVVERNQQVSQMGQIYSCAHTVFIWLGCDVNMAPFLSFISTLVREAPKNPTTMAKYARTYWYREHTKEVATSWLCFAGNAYWTRAWITQELFLAKSLRMVTGSVELGTAELQAIRMLFLPVLEKIVGTEYLQVRASQLQVYLQIMAGDNRLQFKKGAQEIVYRMIDLLFTLRGRACEHPRDQFY
jgi:hypothetical protein